MDYSTHTIEITYQQFTNKEKYKNRWQISFDSSQAVARRLSRIYCHASRHHENIFKKFEEETRSYSRFKKLVEKLIKDEENI
jgi:hypothetical protein